MLQRCLARPQIAAFIYVHAQFTSTRSNLLLRRTFSSTENRRQKENENNDENGINPPYPRRLSVAVVGAGPAGFYTTKYLTSSVLKRIQSTAAATGTGTATNAPFAWSGIDVDLIERLPTPYGLVRYGVAPDHPEVKNVENDFAALFNKQKDEDASCHDHQQQQLSSIAFYGNVEVGTQIPISKLQSWYDIVILAYGCQAADKRLNIPGEDTLEGVLSAREFVAWYNGHPEFQHIGPIVERCLWKQKDDNVTETSISPARVVVIGQGNVALDVARILAKGKPGLIDTDTPTSVLNVLRGGVSHVSVVGRRGHVQGAFTIKELRELTNLEKDGFNASFVVRKEELEMGMTESSVEELKGPGGRPRTRIDKLLQDTASQDKSTPDSDKSVEIRFLLNPTELVCNEGDSSHVGHVVCEKTRLEGDAGKQRPVGTGEMEELPADLVLVSIGYRGMPLEGMEGLDFFDSTSSTVINNHGKLPGENNLFVTGWIKRGPTGIIGTNIMDAKDTVNSVMKYIDSSKPMRRGEIQPQGRDALDQHLNFQGVKAVSWDNFLQIVSAEIDSSRLRSESQPREKFLTVSDMLKAASSS
ncbi:hypothetical protein ACHAWC_001421 [Mediolabrus comicus]